MHGKATYTKVSLLRYYIYFTEISGHVLNAFNDIISIEVLYVGRRRVMMTISTEADNDKRLLYVLLG